MGTFNGVQLSLVERRLWEADAQGSNPCTPITTIKSMEVFTVEEFQERWDELMERVENGEHLGIVNENGNAAVMMPADDELIRIHTELNNEAS